MDKINQIRKNMKVFLSADIEGSCGFTDADEGMFGSPRYEYFRKQMSEEVASACRGAIQAGASDILVRDAHGSARNIDPYILPQSVRLLRGSTGDLFAMMSGLQSGKFDVAAITGFHSGVGSDGNPSSHTFNRKTEEILLNGTAMSEFMFDAYTAAYLHVPVAFISGDSTVCRSARQLIPGITAVETLEGYSGATISPHPKTAITEIEQGIFHALSSNYKLCIPELPSHFTVDIRFTRHQDAYFNSFYSGIAQLDAKTLQYSSTDWLEVLRMIHFILDK